MVGLLVVESWFGSGRRVGFLNGEGQPNLAKAPLSQPVHMRANTKQPATIPPMQPPSQLGRESPEPGGGVDGGCGGGGGGGSDEGEGGGGGGEGGGGDGELPESQLEP